MKSSEGRCGNPTGGGLMVNTALLEDVESVGRSSHTHDVLQGKCAGIGAEDARLPGVRDGAGGGSQAPYCTALHLKLAKTPKN